MNIRLPTPSQRLVVGDKIDVEWYRKLQLLVDAVNAGDADTVDAAAEIAAIATALGSPDGTVANIPPVSDIDLSAITIAGTNIVTVTGSLASGVVEIGGTLLEDSGVGALLGITRDSFGRVSGTTDATITAPAAGITVTNGDAVAGPPTLGLANDLAAVEGLSGTGIAVRTAADTWTTRTLTGTADRITVTFGDGVSGSPTFDIAATYAGQTSITTLGTIAIGSWQATAVGLAYGGTGANYSTRVANTVWAGPTTGADAAPAFRALVAADIPDLSGTYQPRDSDLDTWATLTPSANAQSLVTAANYAAMRALLDLEAGTDFYSIAAADAAFQPLDAQLTDLSGLSYATNALKVIRVNAGETGWELAAVSGGALSDGDYGDITVGGGGTTMTIDAGVVTLAKQADVATATVFYRKTAGTGAPEVQALATLKTDLGLTGTNSGDQTSIVGISGTKAEFDTACTDGDFLFVGDVTQYTDEQAQDAVGAMVDGSLVYVDGTPLLQRAALTGDVTASAGSNSTTIANDAVTYAKMQDVSAASKLLGRGDSGAGDVQELTLGTNLSITGTTLNATGGSGSTLWTVATSNTTMAAGTNYLAVITGNVDFTLPTPIAAGETYVVANSLDSTAATQAKVIVGGGRQINGLAVGDDLYCLPGELISLVARNTTDLDLLTPGAVAGLAWGSLTGTLSDQPDLLAALDGKLDAITADTTFTVGSGGDYADIADAADYVNGVFWPADVSVTLSLTEDQTISSDLIFNLTATGLLIVTSSAGVPLTTAASSAIVSTSGSSGAWSYTVTVGSSTNYAANDIIFVYAASGGSNPLLLCGAHKITSIDSATQITFKNVHRTASVPSGACAATLRRPQTKITRSTTQTIYIRGGRISFTNLGFDFGTSTANCVHVQSPVAGHGSAITTFTSCALFSESTGTNNVLYNQGGNLALSSTGISGNGRGIYAQYAFGGTAAVANVAVAGADVGGFVADLNGGMTTGTACRAIACDIGTQANSGGQINGTAVTRTLCTTDSSPTADTVGNNNSYCR